MNRSIILVTLIALVVAVLVATVVSKTLGGKSGDTEGADLSTTQILVAADRLKMGHEISEKDVKWMAWPDNAMFDGVIKRKSKDDKDEKNEDGDDSKDDKNSAKLEPGMDKVVGKLAMRVVMKNEPITKDMVVDGNKSNFMAATLGEGMRAVAIKIKADSQAGGFIKAGDRVDVIMSYQLKQRGGAEMSAIVSRLVSETILSNIRVLAIDQRAENSANNKDGDDDKKKKGGGNGAKVGKTATLELSKKQAEKLAIAKRMGNLTLVLRRFGEEDSPSVDQQIEFTTDVETADVLRVQSMLVGGGDPSSTVRVYNGNQVNEVRVRGQVSIPNEQSTDN